MKQCCPLIVLLIGVLKGSWNGERIGTFRPVWQPVEPIGWLQEEVPEQWYRRGTLCWSKYYSMAAPPPVYLISSFHADPPHAWRLGIRKNQQDTCTTEGRDSHLKCAEVGKNPQFSRYSMVSCGGGGRHLIYLCSPFINMWCDYDVVGSKVKLVLVYSACISSNAGLPQQKGWSLWIMPMNWPGMTASRNQASTA